MAFKKSTTTTDRISCEIQEDFGTIGQRGKYALKLTYTAWNGGAPKYDLRPWDTDGKCGKGLTLTGEELEGLYNILKDIAKGE